MVRFGLFRVVISVVIFVVIIVIISCIIMAFIIVTLVMVSIFRSILVILAVLQLSTIGGALFGPGVLAKLSGSTVTWVSDSARYVRNVMIVLW